MNWLVPSTCLLGFASFLKVETHGTGVMTSIYHEHRPWVERPETEKKGKLMSMATGKVTAYALKDVEKRGVVFVKPGDETYEGNIIGEAAKNEDLWVNPTKAKAGTNVRTILPTDGPTRLTPPRLVTLEGGITSVKAGEALEVTPKAIRLRRLDLSHK